MKKIVLMLALIYGIPTVLSAQHAEYNTGVAVSLPAVKTVEINGEAPVPASSSTTVAISYHDTKLPAFAWTFPRDYGAFINLYLMQRFTLPTSTAFLDSVSIYIDSVSTGAIRIRVLPDSVTHFANGTFRMPKFSPVLDQIIIDKSALRMRAFNTIRLQGVLVPRDFFITVEFTVNQGKNNSVTLISDGHTAPYRTEQDSRTVMVNQVSNQIQVMLMDSLFRDSGTQKMLFPYLYMTAFTDTATFSPFPAFVTSPPTTAYAGIRYTYAAHASGVPRPTYSLVKAPQGMVINSVTGEVVWMPSNTDVGDHTVTVRASNSNGDQDQTYTLTVVQPTRPRITSTPRTKAIVKELYSYQVTATGGPPPMFALLTGPPGMTISPATGLITMTPADNQVGVFNVSVRASNAVGLDVQSFQLQVDASAVPPQIISTPVTKVAAGQPYAYQAKASGNPEPTWSMVKGPSGMTIGFSTGLVRWNPNPGEEGDYEVTVRAENRAGNDEQTFTVTVTPPPVLPTFTSTPDTTAIAGQLYSYTAAATGSPDPVYRLSEAPLGMSIDSVTGEVKWVPARNQKGRNPVRVSAVNLAGSAEQLFSIYVMTIPMITSTPKIAAEVDKEYTYRVTADAEPAATFSLAMSPTGMTIDATTGEVTWTPEASQLGQHSVSVDAKNPAGTDRQAFTVIVSQPTSVDAVSANAFFLSQNFPNPVSIERGASPSHTRIMYSLPRSAHVVIEVRDLLGRVIRTLVDARKEPGIYTAELNLGEGGQPFDSGVYIILMRSGQYHQTRVMTVIK